jgi:hypothetical protein
LDIETLEEASEYAVYHKPSVLFNPLHDHESVWWIACWALLNYVPADRPLADDEGLHNQIEYARRLFHPTVYAPERAELLQYGIPEKIAANLPEEFGYLMKIIDFLSGKFVERYTKAEAVSGPGEIDNTAFEGFWKTLHLSYGKVSENLKTVKVDLRMEKQKRDGEPEEGGELGEGGSKLEEGGGEKISEDDFSEAPVTADTESKGKGKAKRENEGESKAAPKKKMKVRGKTSPDEDD